MMLRPRFFHHEAIDVLHAHNLEPHNVLLTLKAPLHLSDQNGVKWTFIARRQTRVYLLAKYEPMEQFKEVYSMGHNPPMDAPMDATTDATMDVATAADATADVAVSFSYHDIATL